jgi:hypothetical protein
MKFDYNGVLNTPYKNAEIEVVVEDDCITTAKVFLDKVCIAADELTQEDGSDIPFNKENYTKVMGMMKSYVDKVWEESFAIATANR